ncbi:MAG: N-acetyl-gamma-glutamyl-phosphate reductase [Sphaerochaetaceae bacterium]
MITVGVVGATGYAGAELMRLLCGHSQVKQIIAASQSYSGEKFSAIYPNFYKVYDTPLEKLDIPALAKRVDLLFLSLPHNVSSKYLTPSILDECVVIDLGADFRLKDVEVYDKWYNTTHPNRDLVAQGVYGLCELYREAIKGASLIANPGCYTTTTILTAYPLLADKLIEVDTLIVDAKSGVSGAGRGEKLATLYGECNASVKPYSVASHRHTPEIEEHLSYAAQKAVTLTFTPHLIPMNRGILISLYGKVKPGVTKEHISATYQKFYAEEPFVRLLPEGVLPETRWTKGSNYCDLNFVLDERSNTLIAFGALDNLVKGAAGQAVQNMNIRFGFAEDSGLTTLPAFPI